MDKPTDFDTWADDYIRRLYPFYTKDAAIRVGDALKRQLRDAWDAGQIAAAPDAKQADDPYEQCVAVLEGLAPGVHCHGVITEAIKKIRQIASAGNGGVMADVLFKLKILHWWLSGSFREWKSEIWDRELDRLYCCDGRECGCGGATVRELYGAISSDGDKHAD